MSIPEQVFEVPTPEVPVKPKKSNGEIFKEKYGFSKSFKRNMQKAGFDPFTESERNNYRKTRQAKG